jgi:hypothetical protein
MSSLNDVVIAWGFQAFGLETYDEAKAALVGDLSQDDVASFGDAGSWNEGLYLLALSLIEYFFLLLETGDFLLLESGDKLLMG